MRHQPKADCSDEGAFTTFARSAEPRLRRALVAAYGIERGTEGASEALAYGWENWAAISQMDNPVGYLYRVGQSKTRRRRRPPLPWGRTEHRERVYEPQLDDALASLPARQRQAVLLVHGFEYSLAEAARLIGVRKGTLQNHLDRGMTTLRKKLGEE